MFMLGSVCRVKPCHLAGKRFADDEEVETEVRKWLRQQSKDVYAAGFDALVNQWDKCINVRGGYVEKEMFFFLQVRISHGLPFISIYGGIY
jgi:head-tail adaptor